MESLIRSVLEPCEIQKPFTISEEKRKRFDLVIATFKDIPYVTNVSIVETEFDRFEAYVYGVEKPLIREKIWAAEAELKTHFPLFSGAQVFLKIEKPSWEP